MRSYRALPLLAFVLGCSVDSKPTRPEQLELAVVADGDNGGRPIETDLSGREEVPARTTPGTGRFVMTLNQGLGELCYELTVANLITTAAAAHIHRAVAGVNGGIVVPLIPPRNHSQECKSVAPALIKSIRQHPDSYYVNVHTPTFPGGEVRGQLSK